MTYDKKKKYTYTETLVNFLREGYRVEDLIIADNVDTILCDDYLKDDEEFEYACALVDKYNKKSDYATTSDIAFAIQTLLEKGIKLKEIDEKMMNEAIEEIRSFYWYFLKRRRNKKIKNALLKVWEVVKKYLLPLLKVLIKKVI